MAQEGQPAALHGVAAGGDAKTSAGSKKSPKATRIPRPTDVRLRTRPRRLPDCRERTFSRLWPAVCVLTNDWHLPLLDAIHYLSRRLEWLDPNLYRSLEKAFGVWVLINGVWERRLYLDGLFNMEIMVATLHKALDGRYGFGSGFIAFYPISPSLDECMERFDSNRKLGMTHDKLFPEAKTTGIIYTLFVFDNETLTITVYDSQPRVYPFPDADERTRLEASNVGPKCRASKQVSLPDYSWTFTSHVNPVAVIVDLRQKLETRHGKPNSPGWRIAPEEEAKLYERLHSATDYAFDWTSWEGAPPPTLNNALKLRGNPVRGTRRLDGIRTDPAAPRSGIPQLAARDPADARQTRPKTIATVPVQLPSSSTPSLAAPSSRLARPFQRSTPPRTRSQSRKLASKDDSKEERRRY